MRNSFIFSAILCSISWLHTSAQTSTSVESLPYSPEYIAIKNFYFITVIEKNKEVIEALQKNVTLNNYLAKQKQQLGSHVSDTSHNLSYLTNNFRWQTDTTQLLKQLEDVYNQARTTFDNLIDKEIRPSGYYYRFNTLSNKDFFLSCWRETFKGINIIIDHYGLNKNFRYPSVDSASYNVHGEYYNYFLKDYFFYIRTQTEKMKLFFEPSLTIALDLMKANERNEPGNYEPLEKGENRKAIEQVKKTKFSNYKFTAILIPGEGPELATVALDPVGRLRCELAATRYKQKLAPFIIVSGGNVHPFHTLYTEALEMKKYLMKEDSIPESAIIIEPQARHTTTNFRNAIRLMIRYNMPENRTVLCISTKDQIDYIMDERFDQRNIKELGYVPYTNKLRLSDHEIGFRIIKDCLQIDPIDPLDP